MGKTIGLLALIPLLLACEKDGEQMVLPQQTGSNTHELAGYVKHHNRYIPNARVYLKLNAIEFPGQDTAVYDKATSCGSTAYFRFLNLPSGTHYLYSQGYDTAISETVTGGIPVYLNQNEQNKEIDVPVTE